MSVGELIGVAAEQPPVQEEAVQNAKPPAETTNIFGERALQLQTETLHHTIKDKHQLEAEAVESQRQNVKLQENLSQAQVAMASLEQTLMEIEHQLLQFAQQQHVTMEELVHRVQQSEEKEVNGQREIRQLKVRFADRERQCHSLRESIRAKEAKMAKLNKRNQQSEEGELTLQEEVKELKVRLADQEKLCYSLRERIRALQAEMKQFKEAQDRRQWERNVELHVTHQMDEIKTKIFIRLLAVTTGSSAVFLTTILVWLVVVLCQVSTLNCTTERLW